MMKLNEYQQKVDDWIKTHGVRYFEEKTNTLLLVEAKGADLRVFIVDGQIVGAMKRQAKEGEFRSNLHRGGKATVINLSPLIS